MAEVSGETANRSRRVGLAGGEGRLVDKAAPAARAFARPRGDVERSEFSVRQDMVEVRGDPRTGTSGLGWRAATRKQEWWARQDSNLQPDRYERPALTIELQAR